MRQVHNTTTVQRQQPMLQDSPISRFLTRNHRLNGRMTPPYKKDTGTHPAPSLMGLGGDGQLELGRLAFRLTPPSPPTDVNFIMILLPRRDWLGRVLLLAIGVLTPLCRAIHFTNPDWNALPGEVLRLTWADQVKWATIKLMRGRPEASELGGEDLVISNSPDLELDWRVPSNKPDGYYFLSIYDLSGNTNYSPVFRLQQASVSATIAGSVTATGTIGLESTQTFPGVTLSFVDSFPSATSSGKAAPGTTTTRSSTTTSQETNASSPSPLPTPDLSIGAKAGIAIGATIGILALLGIVSFFFYRRGKQVGASRGAADGDGSDTAGLWGRNKRNRLHSTDGSDLEGGKFRAPTPTPKELSGEDKLPPELGAESTPTEIGTDWPVVAELSTGELCIEEMERACGEIKLDKMSNVEKRMSTLKPLQVGGRDGEKHTGPVSPLTPSQGEKVAAVSPLTPCPLEKESRQPGNEKYLKDGDIVGVGFGHDKRESVTVEIQIQLKGDGDDSSDRRKG